MEYSEREVIRKNLPKLAEYTECNDKFLSIFLSKNTLSRQDIEKINAQGISQGKFNKSNTFFSIIESRSNAYEVLLEALTETNQSGALAILKQQESSCSTSAKQSIIQKFDNIPQYMDTFLKQNLTKVMVVSSKDCRITWEKIIETTPHASGLTPKEFINFISTPEGRRSTSIVSIINCEEYLDSVFRYAHKFTSKVVLITSLNIDELKKLYSKHKKCNVLPNLVEDIILWDDLSAAYQHQLQLDIKTQLQVELQEMCFDEDDIDTENIINVINGKPLQLFNDTLPDEIKYYIRRRIIKRSLVSPDLFKKGGQDIYLFENIERHELSELAEGHRTETYTFLLNSSDAINYQFVKLDRSDHFDKISKKYNDRPVHVLFYTKTGLLWKKSSGSIHNIQTSLNTEQIMQEEDDFMKEIISRESNERCPICISDSPGMGKSILLANFARTLGKLNDRRVYFVVISEFVKIFKESVKQSLVNMKTIFTALVKYLCKNKLGEKCLMSSANKMKELMFDGFDELNSEDIPLSYKILRTIKSDFKDTRIWVTTRPHMFLELEKVLLVLGSNIQSFAETDQINFFKSFWCRNIDSLSNNQTQMAKLEDFAKHCLTSVKSAINNKEEDIAGIPLQCMLIGEVFEDDAQQYCNADQVQNFYTKVSITSMVNLYERLIKNKINKFYMRYGEDGVDYPKLMKMHTFLSIWLLFPQCRRVFKNRLCPKDFSTAVQHIFNVGILESRSVLPAPRFIHRTFAEYFVAKFVVDSLTEPGKSSDDKDLLNFINTHVLKTIVSNIKINKINLKTHDFKNNVVCYFIDALLPKLPNIIIFENSVSPKSGTHLCQLTEACAHNDFHQIYFGLGHKYAADKMYKKTVFTEKMLKIIMCQGGCLLFDVACHYFKDCSSVPFTDIKHDGYTLLHLAVIRGNFSLVENLVSEQNFKELLETKNKIFCDILHECVLNTKQSSITVVNDKKSIISYLTQKNQDFLFEENAKGNLAIECKGVNCTLVKHLFSCGRARFEEKRLQSRILHKLTNNLNSEEYRTFMELMFLEKNKNYTKEIVNMKFNKKYLLDSIFRTIEPEIELMELLKLYGVEFRRSSKKSGLYLAFKYKRSEKCIHWLLNNTNWNNDDINEALSLRSNSIFIITYLLQCENIKVTDFPTMFHSICDRSTLSSEHVELIQQLISKNVDVNYVDRDLKKVMHYLFKSKCDQYSLKVLKLLQEAPNYVVELDVEFTKLRWIINQRDPSNFNELPKIYFAQILTRDSNGNTLLHYAAQTGNIDKVKMALSHCPDINATNSINETALHLLTSKNIFCIECWKFFVDRGADVFAQNWENQLPLGQLKCLEHSEASNAVMHVLTNFIHNNISSVERVLWHVIQALDLEVIKCACEWYKTNFQTPFEEVKTYINGARSTFLEAALQASNEGVLAYVLQDLKCSTTIASSPGDSVVKSMDNTNVNLDLEFKIMQCIIKNLSLSNCKELTNKYFTHVKYFSTRDSDGNTLLHLAAQTGNIEKVEMAFSHCPDINATNTKDETALHLLTNKNTFCIECWKFLVDKRADIFARDRCKLFPLVKLKFLDHSEASHAVLHVLTTFFQNNNSSVEQVLWHVIQALDLEVIRGACEWYETNFQTPFEEVKTFINGAPSTFLEAALQASNEDVLVYVLQDLKCSTIIVSCAVDCIFNCMKNWRGNLNKRMQFIKVLAHHYLNSDLLNSPNGDGFLPLSAEECNEDFVQLLVKLGANINARDEDDNIPLHCVIKRIVFLQDSNLKLIEQHIKCGANVNAVNKQHQTPLLLASQTCYFESVSPQVNLLINNNADPSLTDSSGNNILHLVCEHPRWNQKDFLDILKCLLNKGYYDLVKSRNNANWTPLELAKQKGVAIYKKIVQIMGQYGIDV